MGIFKVANVLGPRRSRFFSLLILLLSLILFISVSAPVKQISRQCSKKPKQYFISKLVPPSFNLKNRLMERILRKLKMTYEAKFLVPDWGI